MNKNYEYFLKIANCQSLTKAANQLFISQPSLSKYLSRLEEDLGITLFDRTASPIKLMPAGELYLDYINHAIALEKALRFDLQELKRDGKSLVRLGIGNWRGSMMLPHFLPVFYMEFPHVNVLVREGDTDFLENILNTYQVDFCIMSLPIRLPGVIVEPIITEKILLLGNNKHPLVRELIKKEPRPQGYRQIDLENLKHEILYLTTSGQNLARKVRAYCKHKEFKTENIREIHNLTTAYNLVKAGWGFAFLPEVGKNLKTPVDDVTFFCFEEPALDFTIAAVYKNKPTLSIYSRRFINFFKEHYQALSTEENIIE